MSNESDGPPDYGFLVIVLAIFVTMLVMIVYTLEKRSDDHEVRLIKLEAK